MGGSVNWPAAIEVPQGSFLGVADTHEVWQGVLAVHYVTLHQELKHAAANMSNLWLHCIIISKVKLRKIYNYTVSQVSVMLAMLRSWQDTSKLFKCMNICLAGWIWYLAGWAVDKALCFANAWTPREVRYCWNMKRKIHMKECTTYPKP